MSAALRSLPHRSAQRLASVCWMTLALITVSSAASAQLSEPAKIAVVDLDRLFLQSAPGKQLQTELQTLSEKVRGDIEAKTKEAENLQAQAAGQTVDVQTQAQRKIEDLDREARRIRDNAQREATKAEQDRRAAFQEIVQPIFAEIQQSQGFDLILNMNRAIVVFAGPRIDITEQILAKITAAP